MAPTEDADTEYVAIIDQDEVTEEVKDIAVKYDPLNRSGHEGFHVTEEGELHIDDTAVMPEHRLIAKKIPNDAIEIVPLPSATGQLVHQYGQNGFRLHELPVPEAGSVIGLLGPNGIGKSTALQILAGQVVPNFGAEAAAGDWAHAITEFRGTTLQSHLEALQAGTVDTAYKPQRVDTGGDHDGQTVQEYVTGPAAAAMIEALDLGAIRNRSLGALSGGERQRVAIAATLATEADLYLFDEPSSFLDVERRLSAARAIRDRIEATGAAAMVVEHDLVTLDLLADGIHVMYGEGGNYGVVADRLGVREGINQFLEGRLRQENVKLRRSAIEFPGPGERAAQQATPVLEYPELAVSFDEFSLTVEPGTVHAGETVGIVGANALGKTTFAKTIAGGIEPDTGTVPESVTVSYKPQYLSAEAETTVREQFTAVTDPYAQSFKTQIKEPFDLEPLFDRALATLSGGELQRVAVALCLARDADLYLLDEPSAFLDVNRRLSLAKALSRTAKRREQPLFVIDHDLFVISRVADRLLVFEGESGVSGHAHAPEAKRDGMNRFLATLGTTFRRDEQTGRPRVNKPDSQLDREQKRAGEYYYSG